MLRITFNQQTSVYASKSQGANFEYLKLMENTSNALFKVRGYLYINDIYEDLGVKWNPEWENHCYIYNNSKIEFKITQDGDDGGFIVDIE